MRQSTTTFAKLLAAIVLVCCWDVADGLFGKQSTRKMLRCVDSNYGECTILKGYCVKSVFTGMNLGGEPYGPPPPAAMLDPMMGGAMGGGPLGFIYRRKREYTGGTGVMGPPAVYVTKGCAVDCDERSAEDGVVATVECCRHRDFCNTAASTSKFGLAALLIITAANFAAAFF